MKKKSDGQKQYTGDKKRIYEYLKEHKTAKTSDIVFDLQIDARKVWKNINELKAEGVIFTTLQCCRKCLASSQMKTAIPSVKKILRG